MGHRGHLVLVDDDGASWVQASYSLEIAVKGSGSTTTTNTAATGAPDISGTAQVGQELTAVEGDMDDDDDLPTTTFPTGYTFQWVRVDGSDETDIGTNSDTYTPVADDVGKTLKVKVSFTDGGGTEETLESAATAAVVASRRTAPTTVPTPSGARR